MKKLTTTILDRDGEEKEIYVFVENETAKVLLQFKDTEIYHKYIVDEYKMQWGDFREKQRGFSLEEAVERKGFDVADDESIEENTVTSVYYEQIKQVVAFLSEDQRFVVQKLFFEEKKAADIARELHISRSAVSQRIKVIYGLLKKFLKKIYNRP